MDAENSVIVGWVWRGGLACLLWVMLMVPTRADLKTGTAIPRFELKTQNERPVSYQRDYVGKVTVLVLSNYCSVELAGVWSIPVYYRFHHHPDFRFAFVFSKACLPGFIPKGFIASSIQNAVTSLKLPYILMDWDNKVSQQLGGHGKHARIYVLDRQGAIRWQHLLTDPMTPVTSLEQTVGRLLKAR